LSMTLTSFRQSLGEDFERVFITSPTALGLRSRDISCDVRRFEELLATFGDGREEALVEALTLYKGELALGFTESWLVKAREELLKLQQSALVERATFHERRGEWRAASAQILKVRKSKLLAKPDKEAYLRLTALAATPQRTIVSPPQAQASLEALTEFDKVLARAGEALLEEERQMLGEVIAHLPDRERRFLGALSLFHGSFSLALVETTTLSTSARGTGTGAGYAALPAYGRGA
jgi:hypothetical protein